MKTHMIRLFVLGAAGGLLVSGCAYHNPATGQEAHYHQGTLRSELGAPVPVVYAAAQRAALDLDLFVGRAMEGAFGAEVQAVDNQGDFIDIRMEVLHQDGTRLIITAGPFGGRRKSLIVFDQVMESLWVQQEEQPIPATARAEVSCADEP